MDTQSSPNSKQEQYLSAYNEAKRYCSLYINYKGDKRTVVYRNLAHAVSDVYMGRMNEFGKKLNLPTYLETFFSK